MHKNVRYRVFFGLVELHIHFKFDNNRSRTKKNQNSTLPSASRPFEFKSNPNPDNFQFSNSNPNLGSESSFTVVCYTQQAAKQKSSEPYEDYEHIILKMTYWIQEMVMWIEDYCEIYRNIYWIVLDLSKTLYSLLCLLSLPVIKCVISCDLEKNMKASDPDAIRFRFYH